jgi:Glycosyl hydrolase 2 galactose-binding domain-like/Exo-beta-D-glucosaminidase Ig-fold domain/Glycosyl hydrolases family 2/NedA-like, galactose-binding domain
VSPSRRGFLKNSAIVGAGVALDAIPGLAASTNKTVAAGATKAHPHALSTTSEFTRGIGVYPGDPREDFSPEMVIDNVNYRNLALLRPAYHSSSYDYNLTAQLVTDGIKDTELPTWIATSAGFLGLLPKNERELVLDHSRTNSIQLFGAQPTLEIQLGGNANVPEVDRIDVVVIPPIPVPVNLTFTASVSDDGRNWEKVGSVTAPQPVSVEGYPPDFAHTGQLFIPSIPFSKPCRRRFYQVGFELANAPQRSFYMQWRLGEVEFYRGDQRVQIGGPYHFTSAWMSAGPGEEWVYIDLGARCIFDHVKLYWIKRAAEGAIQVSDDAEHWHHVHALSPQPELIDDVKLTPTHGRYVRVLMTRPTSPDGYMLSEIEVFGRGGPLARHKKPSAAPVDLQRDRRFDLARSPWRIQRLSLVNGDGPDFSKSGFDDSSWVMATVPGTVLSSYLNVQAVPDPSYGRNQLYVSDSFFYSDFWYRTEFDAPAIEPGNITWLNFDDINWKADVFLNREKLGPIEGAFLRSRFDVTGKLRPGKNALAVRIHKNDTPGSCKQKTFENGGPNGGALGADNPTYHASVGWDWIPTIRGRNTGLVGSVYLTTTGAVTIENPFVTTTLPLPDTSRADISIELDLLNYQSAPVAGTLRGRFGDAQFEQRVTLAGGTDSSTKHIKLDPSMNSALSLQNPKLWWPVGYGDPYLYDVELTFEPENGSSSHKLAFKAGVRQMTYSEEGGALKIWINGRRFIPRGGNWGFSESMLRFRKREFDVALRYHREMNFNMIRDWVGQIGANEFYEACDRYGVMVWQDFWLANPWDGPNPNNDAMFLTNAKDTVLRIRNHPSIGLYCGRNEGYPPKSINDGLRNLVAESHPGLHYIPDSAEDVVGGGGPYMVMPLTYYPTVAAFPKLHSEIGMPNIPSIESVRAMLSPSGLWPPGLEWGLHDLPEGGFRRGPSLMETIENIYGATDNLEEWVTLAHFLDYDGFRAEFEAQSKNRMGLLLWMSQSCWPSLLWQTYDYYMEPTAAYFASKNACEPLHIQWNRVTDAVEVVNYSAGTVQGLTALAEVLNMNGSVKWKKSALLDSFEDSSLTCMQIEYPAGLTPVHFVRLTLSSAGSQVSRNLYMRGTQEANLKAIRQLAKAQVKISTEAFRRGDIWKLTTQLHNLSDFPALMVRLKVVRDRTGDRILPVIYDDNYVTLMPGEQATIHTEVNHADTRGERPRMVVGGYNVKPIVG